MLPMNFRDAITKFLAVSRASLGLERTPRRRQLRFRLPRFYFEALEARAMLSGNTGLEFSVTPSINENGIATLVADLGDSGLADDVSVVVDWGDGSAQETFAVSAGTSSFSAAHRYLDDGTTATSSDDYSVNVKVNDANGDAYIPTPSPDGPAFVVNTQLSGLQTTENFYGARTIASDADGNYVVTWTSFGQDGDGYGVFAQRFDSVGNPIGDEIQVNSQTSGNQQYSSIATDAEGNFIVTWSSAGQSGAGSEVYAQRFDSDGNRLGDEIQANTYTANDQHYSSVAMDAAGNFVIAWASDSQDGEGYGVYAQRYDRLGNSVGSEFLVNTVTSSEQSAPSIAMNAGGEFVVIWSSLEQDGFAASIYGQRYDGSGVAQGSQFRVDTQSNSIQEQSSVAINDDGDFVVSWSSFNFDGSFNGVYARQFGNDGSPVAAPIEVAPAMGQLFSSVAIDRNGNFAVSWDALNEDGLSSTIFAQRFDSTGSRLGAEITVSEGNTFQTFASIANRGNGGFIVNWSTADATWSDWDIYARQFNTAQLQSEFVLTVTVNNVAPTIGAGASEILPAAAGGQFSRTVGFADVGSLDTHTITVNYGDGFGDQSVTPGANNSFDLDHVFASEGTFRVNVSVEDDDLGLVAQSFDVTVELNTAPVAVDDDVSIDEDNSLLIDVIAANGNGEDWDAENNIDRSLTQLVGPPPALGILTNNNDGTFTFDPNGEFEYLSVGQGEKVDFQYQIEDTNGQTSQATVRIEVVGVNDAPVAADVAVTVGENDPAIRVFADFSDVDLSDSHVFDVDTSGTIGSVANTGSGAFFYNPGGQFEYLAAGETANDSFVYFVEDAGGLIGQATVTITVTGANDAPVAVDVSVNVDEDGPAVGISADFTDVDGNDSHLVDVDASGTTGIVTNNNDGTFTYDPNGQFEILNSGETATDSFEYIVKDVDGATSTATVLITINGQFDAQEFVIDGSFETEAPINGFGFVATSPNDGWQSLNGQPLEIWQSGFNGVDSNDGAFHLELDAHANQVDSIYQDLQTDAGQLYKLTFDIRARSSNFNSLDESVFVDWNGQSLDVSGYRADQAGQWTTITAYVVGTGGLDRLLFRESADATANDSTGPFLDDVNLERFYSLEAEDLNRGGFIVRNSLNASNSQIVRLSGLGGNGSLWTNFAGVDGSYDMSLFVQDESDGVSSITMSINGVEVQTIVLDQDSDGLGNDNGLFSEFIIEDVEINTGDLITFTAQGNSGEYVRIDRVGLTRTGDVSSGVVVTENVIIADEDFESGAAGWSNPQTGVSQSGDGYLGGFGRTNDVIDTSKTFSIPTEVEQLTIQFDFLEIDSWNNENFWVGINGSEYNLGTFDWRDNETDTRTWQVAPGIQIQKLDAVSVEGYGTESNISYYQNDYSHRYVITITNPDDLLSIGFGSDLNSASSNESWGVDNLLITGIVSVND